MREGQEIREWGDRENKKGRMSDKGDGKGGGRIGQGRVGRIERERTKRCTEKGNRKGEMIIHERKRG